jgi:hypothetical protein
MTRLTKSQMTPNNLLYINNSFAYCYQLVNVISWGASKCDHIKWRLLFQTILRIVFLHLKEHVNQHLMNCYKPILKKNILKNTFLINHLQWKRHNVITLLLSQTDNISQIITIAKFTNITYKEWFRYDINQLIYNVININDPPLYYNLEEYLTKL